MNDGLQQFELVEVTAAGGTSVRRRRGTAAVAATVVVVAAGAFTAGQIQALGAAGAKSPEAAVEAMFESLSENDVIGVLDHLAPGEREMAKDATLDYVDELTRLGVLDETIDLAAVPGFEFSYADLTYDVEQANSRVWLVEVTGGTVTMGANVAELPLGEMIFERLDLATMPPTETVTIDIAEELGAELGSELGGDALRVAVVADGGSYYVSSMYTAAELAAASAGYSMPAAPIPAVGAPTPEDAVRGMIDAAIDLDVAGLIELTPPDEMAALHDYGAILVELADEAMAEADIESELEGWTFSVDALEFDEVPVTGGIKLLPTHIALSGSDVEGRSFEAEATKVDTTCVEYAVSTTEVAGDSSVDSMSASGRLCAADIRETFEDSDVPLEVQDIAERMVGQLGQVGVVTVEVGGSWYVSPSRTGGDLMLVAMQGLQRGDIETLWDFAGGSFLALDEDFTFDDPVAQAPATVVVEVTPATTEVGS